MMCLQTACRPGGRALTALTIASLTWSFVAAAAAQDATTRPTPAPRPTTARDSSVATTRSVKAAAPAATQPAGPTTAMTTTSVPSELAMNFRDASLQAVLEYLSEVGGLIILDGARVEGRVTIMSRQPVSTEEAVALLDTVLKDKGYATIHSGRTLRIVPIDQAAKENLPVYAGSDPSLVPATDRVVTQVIPIRHADATKLRTDLGPLIGATATLTANKESNSLILVDTQSRIRRVMEIIHAMDQRMAGVAEVKVYPLQFANATNTARLITELFRQDRTQGQQQPMPFRFGRFSRGRGESTEDAQGGLQQRVVATADDRTNTLVVSAPPDMVTVIDGIVKELDSDPTEEQTVFIYPLKNAQSANLEDVLNQIFSESTTSTAGRTSAFGTTGGRTSSRFSRSSRFAAAPISPTAAASGDLAGQVFVIADEDTNSLLVRCPTAYVDRVKQILADLDRPIRQVLIKVLIAEVTHDGTLDLGMEFSILNLRSTTSGTFVLDLGNTPDDSSNGLITTTLDAALSATFNALQRDGRLDVLSRPYILTSDNKEANITVGQEVPFIRQSRTTETGQTINTIEYEDVGIILTVTPHINPDGLVIMTVVPEISSVSDTTVPISETVNATVYNKRSAQTQVAIQNGQTIVIGGLIEDRITDAIRKVPLLGDIPGLELLFRRVTKQKVKTELLIFLTPRVADSPNDLLPMSQDETADIGAVREAGGPGAFEEHMQAMQRGATTQPAGGPRHVQP